jgi:uncharacterized protein YjbJ (UPF0337 family)
MPKLSHNAHKVKTQARSRWDKLTEDDFDAIENNALELATRLQARYGIAAEEAQKQAEQFMNSLNNAATDVYSEGKEVLDNVADRVCQFASNCDPLFASNVDPSGAWDLGLSM